MTTPNSVIEQTPEEPLPQVAPLTKEELEKKKLELEIKELTRPFWQRPAYAQAALATLLAAITLSVGFVNGFFSAQLTKLDNQKHDIEAEIKKFEETRTTLTAQNEKLRQDILDKESKLTDIRRIGARLRGAALELDMHQAEIVPDRKPDAEMQRIQKEFEDALSDLTKLVESDKEPY